MNRATTGPVRLRSIAEAELAEAVEWYAAQSKDAAARFLDSIDEAFSQIQRAPEAFPLVTPTLRRILVRHFPYAVY